jgi:hypothetical protein
VLFSRFHRCHIKYSTPIISIYTECSGTPSIYIYILWTPRPPGAQIFFIFSSDRFRSARFDDRSCAECSSASSLRLKAAAVITLIYHSDYFKYSTEYVA